MIHFHANKLNRIVDRLITFKGHVHEKIGKISKSSENVFLVGNWRSMIWQHSHKISSLYSYYKYFY